MIKKITDKMKNINKNIYPITISAKDEEEYNDILFKVVNELKNSGIDAKIFMAQGTYFGYIFCKKNEIDEIQKSLVCDDKCELNIIPVNNTVKKLVIKNTIK